MTSVEEIRFESGTEFKFYCDFVMGETFRFFFSKFN